MMQLYIGGLSRGVDMLTLGKLMSSVAPVDSAENRALKPNGFLSVYPMHMGNKALLEIVEKTGLFRLRDIINPPNSKSPGSVLNFVTVP